MKKEVYLCTKLTRSVPLYPKREVLLCMGKESIPLYRKRKYISAQESKSTPLYEKERK